MSNLIVLSSLDRHQYRDEETGILVVEYVTNNRFPSSSLDLLASALV